MMTAITLSSFPFCIIRWTLHWAIVLAGPILVVSSSAYAQEIAVFDGNGTVPADERVDNQGTHIFTGSGQTHIFTIKNTGLSDLSGLRWEVVGPAAGDFVLGSSSSAALPPDATTSFNVTFTSAVLGVRVAIIRVFSNDLDENPFEIVLSGTGGTPEIAIEHPADTPLAVKSIIAWGANESGQTTIPAGLTGTQAIAAGGSHTVALTADGTVVAWGDNRSGQTTIPAGLSEVKAIAAGTWHTVALKADATVVAWGANERGQTTIPAGLSGVKAIEAGESHTVALKADGTVVAWGSNERGQTTIPAGLSGVKAIAAGAFHTVALKADGTVVAWGANERGQTTIPAGLSGVKANAAGFYHTVALKDDGTVVAWGDNGFRQTTIPAGLSGVKAIAAGGGHTVALAGSTVGFGDQAISTSSESKSFLVKSTGTGKLNITSVTILGDHSADFKLNTAEMAMSLPAVDGQTTFSVNFMPSAKGYREARLQVVNDDVDEGIFEILLTGFSPYDADIAVYDGSSTAPANERQTHLGTRVFPATLVGKSFPQIFTIKNAGPSDSLSDILWDIVGPGAADFSLASLGTTALTPNSASTFSVVFNPKSLGTRVATLRIYSNDPDENPFEINLSGSGVSPEISLSNQAGAALETSRIAAWGNATVPAGVLGVEAIAAGRGTTMAVKADGTVAAWGGDSGLITITPSGLSNVQEVAIGEIRPVALKTDGTVVGLSFYGLQPTQIPANLSGVKAIAAGWHHTVALKLDGTVVAWGDNSNQQLNTEGISEVQAIAANYVQTVALKQNGDVVAWGLGSTSAPAGLADVQAIAAGIYHTVALKRDGTVVAWGGNFSGQTTIPAGLKGVQAIAAGGYHTVALKHDGTVVAWGSNGPGQTTIPAGLGPVQAIAAGEYHTVVIQGSKVAFGEHPASSASVVNTFSIKNTGTAPLQIASVGVVGTHASDFNVSTVGMLTSIPPVSGHTTFTVTFRPGGSGTRTARLLVKSDDLDEGDYLIWLTGANNPPQAVGTLPDQEVRIGTPLTIDLSSYFTDPDGGLPAYSLVSNSNPTAASATLSGSILQLSGLTQGLTEISLLATDAPGGSILSTFRVKAVNEFTVLNPMPELEVSGTSRLADGSILLQIDAIPGRSYQVETSPDLSSWTTVPIPIQAGATRIHYIDHAPPPDGAKRFYRVREITR